HGTALPILLFGPSLNGSGVHGKDPDLNDLDEFGNLKLGTDFRSIYATILENWLCIDGTTVNEILGDNYARLPDIGLSCSPVSNRNAQIGRQADVPTRITPQGGGQYLIDFELLRGGEVNIELVTMSGRRIMTVTDQYFHAGPQQVSLNLSSLGVRMAPLVYSLRTNGKVYSRKFVASSF
ncbi:MAG: hypothetical protein AAGA62_17070, partial [Bacteroidota bacterium]